MFPYKRMKLDLCLTSLTKVNSKGIKDLTVRAETMKLLEENIRIKLLDMGVGNDFLDMTPEAQATKSKIHKWDDIKPKASAQQRKPSTK